MSARILSGASDTTSLTRPGPSALASPIAAIDGAIEDLGKCLLTSPVVAHLGESAVMFAGSAEKKCCFGRSHDRSSAATAPRRAACLSSNWPDRATRFFSILARVDYSIITCGGLRPGINKVVRGLVLELARGSCIKRILGLRYG